MGCFSRGLLRSCWPENLSAKVKPQLNASKCILRHLHTLDVSSHRLQPAGVPWTPHALVGSIEHDVSIGPPYGLTPQEARRGRDVMALQLWGVVNVCGEEWSRVLQQGCSFRAQAGTAGQEGRTLLAQVGTALADGTTFVAQAPTVGHQRQDQRLVRLAIGVLCGYGDCRVHTYVFPVSEEPYRREKSSMAWIRLSIPVTAVSINPSASGMSWSSICATTVH